MATVMTYTSSPMSDEMYHRFVNCYKADLEWSVTKVSLAYHEYQVSHSQGSYKLLVMLCEEHDAIAGILADLLCRR